MKRMSLITAALALTFGIVWTGAEVAEVDVGVIAVEAEQVDARITGLSSCSWWKAGNRGAGWCSWSPWGPYATFHVGAKCWKPGYVWIVESARVSSGYAITPQCPYGYQIIDSGDVWIVLHH